MFTKVKMKTRRLFISYSPLLYEDLVAQSNVTHEVFASQFGESERKFALGLASNSNPLLRQVGAIIFMERAAQ
jgi:hypothetical protein